jgi:hypothetical protein
MNREVHVRICGGGRVRFPPATRRGERRGKGALMRQAGIRKMVRSLGDEIAVEVSLSELRWHQNRGVSGASWEEPGGCPLTGRAVSGM